MKTDILKYGVVAILFTFFHFIEAKCGIAFLAVPFLFALTLSKQNLLITAPMFFGLGIAINFSLWNLLFWATPIVILLITLFIHYKIGKRPKSWLFMLYALISYTPRLVLGALSLGNVVYEVAGAVLCLPTFYLFLSILYATITKRLNYPLSTFEKLSFFFFTVVSGFGLFYLKIFFFSIYEFVLLIMLMLLPLTGRTNALFCSVGMGIGALFHSGEAFACSIAYGVIVSLFKREYAYFGGVGAVALKGIAILFGVLKEGYLGLIAIALATIIVIVIPSKIKTRVVARFSPPSGAVTRALINKNRAIIRDKIAHLSSCFYEVGASLKREESAKELNARELASEVVNAVCKRCSHFQACKKKLGGNSTEMVVQELMGSAIEMGKASILDASPFLSSQCVRLNGLIVKANEILYEREELNKKEREKEESKSLLREQVEGLGSVLTNLSKEVGSPIVYDLKRERSLRDAFNEAGIAVSELVVYENGNLCMDLSEDDARKSRVREIVSRTMGAPMKVIEEKKSVDGRVSVTYGREAKYKVAYGERVLSASESGVGDREAVVRLSESKIMLCLSDGMGHGKEAEENSTCAINLIKSLYKAGFDHLTVLRSVQALLKTRQKEEFNAVDIAVIDTFTGEVDVIKQGAREGYVITPDGLEEIACGSLPLGIVEEVVPVTEVKKLTTRDFIVLLSDGIIDGLGKERLEEILSKIDTRNPDDICSIVMDNVVSFVGEDRDDCSIICARLF